MVHHGKRVSPGQGSQQRKKAQLRLSVRALLAGLAASSGAGEAHACDPWQRVFETSAKGVGFACVIAGRGAEWIAAGVGILAAGTDKNSSERSLDGLAMEGFGVGPDGTLYATGSHGTIWRRVDGADFKQEHQTRAPGTRGRGRDADLLVGVRTLSLGPSKVVVAHSPSGNRSFVRDAKGAWLPPADAETGQRLMSLALQGPEMELPKDCVREQWRWIGESDGFALCRDRRAFAFYGGTVVPLGKAPKLCDVLYQAAHRGDETFVACGTSGTLYRIGKNQQWNAVAGLKDVHALAANERCVVAATDRAVFQQCLPGSDRKR